MYAEYVPRFSYALNRKAGDVLIDRLVGYYFIRLGWTLKGYVSIDKVLLEILYFLLKNKAKQYIKTEDLSILCFEKIEKVQNKIRDKQVHLLSLVLVRRVKAKGYNGTN